MNPPADSPQRAAAVASVQSHGPLAAAHAEADALRARLADTTRSLVASVQATAGYQREAREALARIEAVRALHPRVLRLEVLHCGSCAKPWPCPTIAALDPTEGAP